MTLPHDLDAASLFLITDVAERARRLAQAAHAGQLDKAGNDYFEAHLVDVFRMSSATAETPTNKRRPGCTTLSKTPV